MKKKKKMKKQPAAKQAVRKEEPSPAVEEPISEEPSVERLEAEEKKPRTRQADEFLGDYIEQPPKRGQVITAGAQVIMTRRYKVPDDIIGRIFTVVREPRYEHGRRMVELESYKGSYPADGLKVVG